jgi:tyrosyl-tRNA synthetase
MGVRCGFEAHLFRRKSKILGEVRAVNGVRNTRFRKRDLEHADLPAFSPTEREDLTAVAIVSDVYREVFDLRKSHSEVSRLIKQSSVEIDGMKVKDPKAKIALRPGQVLRLDRKHAVRIG